MRSGARRLRKLRKPPRHPVTMAAPEPEPEPEPELEPDPEPEIRTEMELELEPGRERARRSSFTRVDLAWSGVSAVES